MQVFARKLGDTMSKKVKETQDIAKIENELDPRQHMVIHHLLLGMTQQDAANAVGVDPATVSRWKNEPAFIAELNRRQSELYEVHTAEMLSLAGDARRVLRESMQHGPNRLKAAMYVLDRLGNAPSLLTVEDITIERRRVEQDKFFRSLS